MRLLLVEDSDRLRDSLCDGLQASGYAIDAVDNGRDGLLYASTTEYDLVILDLMLPEMDGLSVLRALRERSCHVPVLILSARDRLEHRVEGLRSGADDYLVKPFAFEELLARVEALCRRACGVAKNVIRVGAVSFDLGCKRFVVNDEELVLTRREYGILEFLFLHRDEVVSRAELEEHVYPADRQVWSNSVDSAVAAIRRKLAGRGVRDLIRTRRGRGYCVTDDAAESVDLPTRGAGVQLKGP